MAPSGQKPSVNVMAYKDPCQRPTTCGRLRGSVDIVTTGDRPPPTGPPLCNVPRLVAGYELLATEMDSCGMRWQVTEHVQYAVATITRVEIALWQVSRVISYAMPSLAARSG